MSMGGAVFLSKDIQCGRNESRMLPILAFCFLFLRNTIIYIKEITAGDVSLQCSQASTALRRQVKSFTHTSKSKIKRKRYSSRLLKSVVEG